MSDETSQSEDRLGEAHDVGIMQGVPPGRRINDVNILDLRGVSAQDIAKIEEIHDVSILLLSEESRSLLRGVRINDVSTIVTVDASVQVQVTPQLDFSHSILEAMPSGQKTLVVGTAFFKPDIPPALVLEKFENLRVVGILIACEGVYGALMSKMQNVTGPCFILPDDTGHVARSTNEMILVKEYLSNLPDDTTFLNFASLKFYDGIPVETFPEIADLLRKKIRAYYNMAETKGPASLLAVLQARCPNQGGRFQATDL